MKLRRLQLKLRKLLLYRLNKIKLLPALLCLVILFTNGCAQTKTQTNSCSVMALSLPSFPSTSPKVADELEEVCPSNKCEAIYDWIGKLKVLEEQLELYKGY